MREALSELSSGTGVRARGVNTDDAGSAAPLRPVRRLTAVQGLILKNDKTQLLNALDDQLSSVMTQNACMNICWLIKGKNMKPGLKQKHF